MRHTDLPRPVRRSRLARQPIPFPIAARIFLRTAFMWVVVRIAALFAALMAAKEVELAPSAILFLVGVVVFLRYIDGRKRNEFLLLQNMGIHPMFPLLISAATATLFEVLLGVTVG